MREPVKLWWMSGAFGFVISSLWLRSWRAFVGLGRQTSAAGSSRPPGPISNQDLFGLDGNVKANLAQGIQQDYCVIEHPLWEFYVNIYGGGPPVIRYNSSGMTPALGDESVKFDGDWRDRHPFSGTGVIFDPYTGAGFQGEIQNGFLHAGKGKGLLEDGCYFQGEVRDGVPHGHGRLVSTTEGCIREGKFFDGRLHGEGKVTYTSGERSGEVEEGEWEYDELLGI